MKKRSCARFLWRRECCCAASLGTFGLEKSHASRARNLFWKDFCSFPDWFLMVCKCLWKLLFGRHRQKLSQSGNVDAMGIRKLNAPRPGGDGSAIKSEKGEGLK